MNNTVTLQRKRSCAPPFVYNNVCHSRSSNCTLSIQLYIKMCDIKWKSNTILYFIGLYGYHFKFDIFCTWGMYVHSAGIIYLYWCIYTFVVPAINTNYELNGTQYYIYNMYKKYHFMCIEYEVLGQIFFFIFIFFDRAQKGFSLLYYSNIKQHSRQLSHIKLTYTYI